MADLTRTEKNLRSEVEEIAATINMDVWNIQDYEPSERLIYLRLMKDKLIRSEVINKYTLIDEHLSSIICNFYFRRKVADNVVHYQRLWHTKRFRVFVHHMMDEIYLLKKMEIVHALKPLPKGVRSAIHRINEVRNALAHSFFPENLRRYMQDKKVTYSGVHLFSVDGLSTFLADYRLVSDCLRKRVYGAA